MADAGLPTSGEDGLEAMMAVGRSLKLWADIIGRKVLISLFVDEGDVVARGSGGLFFADWRCAFTFLKASHNLRGPHLVKLVSFKR
jgi:hypothetical protein